MKQEFLTTKVLSLPGRLELGKERSWGIPEQLRTGRFGTLLNETQAQIILLQICYAKTYPSGKALMLGKVQGKR